jgi:hypothetical protein
LEGDELWIGYDMETEFPAGLTRVMAKSLPESGRESGLGRVTGLRLFPYPGAIRLAGLGQMTARVTELRHFPYPV